MQPDTWAKTISDAVASCDVRLERPDAFSAVVEARTFADVEFIDVRCDRHSTSRTRSHVAADAHASYFLVIPLTGVFTLSQDGRRAVLGPGAVCFFDSMRPAAVETSDGFRGLCVKVPSRLLSQPPQRLIDNTARDLTDQDGGVTAVVSMLLSLHERIHAIDSAAQFTMVRAVVGLIDSLLASLDPERDRESSRAEATDQDIKAYIEQHLGDPELGPSGIAAAHYMSVRGLHYLFEQTGTTVSTWIRVRRVERCQADLAAPALREVPIAVIAHKWGFKTTSHFGQVFKAVTGMTPRQFRTQHSLPAHGVSGGSSPDASRADDTADAAPVDYASLNHFGWPA